MRPGTLLWPLPLLALLALPGCLGPGAGVMAARRGAVELAVKEAYPGILDEIEAGGGPSLGRALDAAGVPQGERATRIAQLRGDLPLHEGSPGALVAALLLYGR